MRIWRQRGEHQQAIGRSRGGRTTKIHALTDAECRPVAFLLTGGQIADCTAGAVLLAQMPRSAILHGDKGYDSDAIRRQVEGKLLSVLRLAKASATYAGGAEYIAWKINRHAGTKIELKPWQKRHPLLAAISLLPRLLRSGAIR